MTLGHQLGNRLAHGAIFAFDAPLRRLEGIYEFSQDPACVLRISRGRSQKERVFTDGTILHVGDPVIQLHWWNEHLPPLEKKGPDFHWGLHFYHVGRHSLLQLAQYINETPGFDDVVAFYGETSFGSEMSCLHYARVLKRVGFEMELLPPAPNPLEQAARFFKHLHVWALTWVFNPVSLRNKRILSATRGELWISRRNLLQYCAGIEAPSNITAAI